MEQPKKRKFPSAVTHLLLNQNTLRDLKIELTVDQVEKLVLDKQLNPVKAITFKHVGSSKTTHVHILMSITNRNKKREKIAYLLKLLRPTISSPEFDAFYTSVQEATVENFHFLAQCLLRPCKYDLVKYAQKSAADVFSTIEFVPQLLAQVEDQGEASFSNDIIHGIDCLSTFPLEIAQIGSSTTKTVRSIVDMPKTLSMGSYHITIPEPARFRLLQHQLIRDLIKDQRPSTTAELIEKLPENLQSTLLALNGEKREKARNSYAWKSYVNRTVGQTDGGTYGTAE